jgi:hypothetical protein
MIRVPQLVISILPQLQDLMQHLEENDRDSVEVISAVLSTLKRQSVTDSGPLKVS